jgi:hypothetical protein
LNVHAAAEASLEGRPAPDTRGGQEKLPSQHRRKGANPHYLTSISGARKRCPPDQVHRPALAARIAQGGVSGDGRPPLRRRANSRDDGLRGRGRLGGGSPYCPTVIQVSNGALSRPMRTAAPAEPIPWFGSGYRRSPPDRHCSGSHKRRWRWIFGRTGVAGLRARKAPGPEPVKAQAALSVVEELLAPGVSERPNWTLPRLGLGQTRLRPAR